MIILCDTHIRQHCRLSICCNFGWVWQMQNLRQAGFSNKYVSFALLSISAILIYWAKCFWNKTWNVFSCPGSSIPDLGQWVSEWVSQSLPLLNFETKSDFWHLKLFRHLIRVMSRQKDKKTKRQTDKNRKRQKDKKDKRKDQKESLILWRQGSFALLRCFYSVL